MYSAPDYLIADFTPVSADRRVSGTRRALVFGAISLAVSLVVVALIAWFNREQMRGVLPWVVLLVPTLISVAMLVWRLVAWRLAVADRRRVGQGPALVIGRFGVEVNGRRSDWAGVRALTTKNRWGNGADIVVDAVDGSAGISLAHLDVLPATLDSAARIYSGGRHGVDLSALDD